MNKLLVFIFLTFLSINTIIAEPTDDQIRHIANFLEVPFPDLRQFVQSFHNRNIPNGIIKIDINTLFEELKVNSARVEYLYKDKYLEITGIVNRIDANNIIITNSQNSYNTIEIQYLHSERNKVINLNRGQDITIIGKFKSGNYNIYGWMSFEEAYIIQ